LSDGRSCGEEEEEGEEEGGDEEGGASIHVSFQLNLAQLSHISEHEKHFRCEWDITENQAVACLTCGLTNELLSYMNKLCLLTHSGYKW
jgi:hypothetical protein